MNTKYRFKIDTALGMVCLSGCLLLTGCGVPLLPIPAIKYAPHTEMLAEKAEIPLVQAALKAGEGGRREVMMSMRSGRVLAVGTRGTGIDLLEHLSSATLRPEFSSAYVHAFKFRQLKAGSRHYYNFTITPEFERANSHYLDGRGEEAIEQIERILADGKNESTLLWQASYLKVNVLIMMGRPDEAERETVRLERLEIAAMGKNHTSRALRAEVRYWAGDLEGALEDAGQVARAFGDWRYEANYSSPPLDQVELARCATAQVRAHIVLGLTLLSREQARAALPWLELASQTMNNVIYTSRHPVYSLYFQPPEEIFWGRGMSLVALGTALMTLDPESARAKEAFEHAQEFFDALGFRAGNVLIETFKAHALFSAGDHAGAEQQAKLGTIQAEKLGLIEYVWRLEALRGRALLALGQDAEAERALRHAQAVVDLMAGTLVSDDSRVRFGVGKEGITHDLIGIDMRKHDLPRLFDDMERGRARAFIALLANRVVAEGRGGDLALQIRALDRDIRRERQRKNALSIEGEIDAGREQKLLEQRAALIARLREHDADLADTLAVSSVDLATVRKALPRNTLMVYAIPSNGSNLNLLFITRDAAEVRQIGVIAVQLQELLGEFNATLGKQDAGPQHKALHSIREAMRLSDWPRAEAIYFVPSGPTHFLPWGAMDVDSAVAVLPAGGWVARSPLVLKDAARSVVVGDPEFGGLLRQLPGARAEAQAVSQIYGVKALVGDAATEAQLRERVGTGVDVLHFATHALFDPVYPLQSSLIMSDGMRAVPLSAERLFAQPLNARLVILSACETGMGQVASGEDLLGITRSFYLGGASSVVSSLWPVDDEATRLFMETFHRQSRGGNYGKAWLAARDTLRDSGFAPSAYGAFVLGGSLGTLP